MSRDEHPLPFDDDDDDDRQLDRRDESFYHCDKHGPVLPICLEVCVMYLTFKNKKSPGLEGI
jgi:hypothetical protein